MNAPARISRDDLGQFKGQMTKQAARRNREEGKAQTALAAWCRMCLKPEVLFFSIPNQRSAKPTAAQLANLIAEGMYPGAGDLCFMWPDGRGFIEMKAKDGVHEENQIQFQHHAERAHALYAVCRSSDEAIDTLKAWGVPHREIRKCK